MKVEMEAGCGIFAPRFERLATFAVRFVKIGVNAALVCIREASALSL
jgi:hypothetical protein